MGEHLAEGQLGEQPHPMAALPTQPVLGALCVVPDLGGPRPGRPLPEGWGREDRSGHFPDVDEMVLQARA